jgi:hypothetical protein
LRIDAGTLAAILTIGTIVVGAATGLAGHLLGRRAASGRVSTSEASVLWAQAQDMRHAQDDRLARTEDQRDRLIAAYTTQVLPMLSDISTLVTGLTDSVAEGVSEVHRIAAALRLGGDHATSAPDP